LLHQIYAESIPILIQSCHTLKDLVSLDDVEKYMEIYEVSEADVQEALSGAVISEIDDQESLRALRAMHLRFAILRRVILCHLLSLNADGTRSDLLPWSIAVSTMDHFALASAEWTDKINGLIKEDKRFSQPPSTPITSRSSPEKEKYRQQLRRANDIAAELRTMQAKLFIFRDDVTRILDGEGNTSTLQTLFFSQAESLGGDLRNLQSTYDTWRSSLLPQSNDSSRRISLNSAGMRSPMSVGALWSVDEASVSNGKPIDALRILSGESSSETSPRGSSADEEVFEAIGMPRVRRSLTREEKMNWMQEEEARRAFAKEQRQTSGSMMRELESVIKDRRGNRMSTGNIQNFGGRVISL
jgi:Mysoin-binding motif of peroxisomes